MSTAVEPCCHDCFWGDRENYTEYSKGFSSGMLYASKSVQEMLQTLQRLDPSNGPLYKAFAVDVERKFASGPN